MHEISLMCPEDRVETLSEALDALDALSVCVEDLDADTASEHALFAEPGLPAPREAWQRSRITALFASEAAAAQARDLLQVQDFFDDCAILAITPVPEQDWVRATQSQFQPVPITPEFWIVPSWHEAPAQARVTIALDPGLAFGTGTHPTTAMCLRWIAAQQPPTLARVLDYGCGSGILAIGAAKFGAAHIEAVDIDTDAVTATIANARANGVTLTAGTPEIAQGLYDVVLANILATPLKILAPLLAAHVKPGGYLVLAGILERQSQELCAAYAPWLNLRVAETLDGWVLMTAQRPQ